MRQYESQFTISVIIFLILYACACDVQILDLYRMWGYDIIERDIRRYIKI